MAGQEDWGWTTMASPAATTGPASLHQNPWAITWWWSEPDATQALREVGALGKGKGQEKGQGKGKEGQRQVSLRARVGRYGVQAAQRQLIRNQTRAPGTHHLAPRSEAPNL